MRALRGWWSCLMAALALPLCAAAQEGSPAPAADVLTVRTSLKGSALVARDAVEPAAEGDRVTTETFWRVRIEPQVRLGSRATLALAYEHRLTTFPSDAANGTGGVLPPESPAPFRIRPLDWPLATTAHVSWWHEVDRAALALHLPRAEVTLGRQAIGWGRGVLFSAVDLFAPFTPLEADREWRRGVDAVRADVKLTDRVSLDGVAAMGATLDASAFAARLRGYAGRADMELVGGRRARDLFAGITSSGAVGEAAVYGELALFVTPAESHVVAGARRRPVKSVLGGSYRFPVGQGVLVYAEYHYSGFGAARPADIGAWLASEDGRTRYLRGDTQLLGRHVIAIVGTYEASPALTVTGNLLQSPRDGSGVLVPSVTITLGDAWSLLASAYVPHGEPPVDAVVRTEYGAAPGALFLQVRLYR